MKCLPFKQSQTMFRLSIQQQKVQDQIQKNIYVMFKRALFLSWITPTCDKRWEADLYGLNQRWLTIEFASGEHQLVTQGGKENEDQAFSHLALCLSWACCNFRLYSSSLETTLSLPTSHDCMPHLPLQVQRCTCPRMLSYLLMFSYILPVSSQGISLLSSLKITQFGCTICFLWGLRETLKKSQTLTFAKLMILIEFRYTSATKEQGEKKWGLFLSCKEQSRIWYIKYSKNFMRFKVFGPLKCLLNINKLFKLTKGYIRELLSLSLIDSSEY